MRRPRDIWASQGRTGAKCFTDGAGCEVFLLDRTAKQYRRVAAWLRRVADWYEWLATKQEAKR